VIMNMYNASGLVGMLGIKSNAIKSGPNRDLGNPLRPMTEQERVILQSMVDNFYDQFVHIVASGRKLSAEKVKVLADGRVYTGVEDHKLGLVDDVGYLENAVEMARKMSQIPDARLIAYGRSYGYHGSIYSRMPQIPSEINVKVEVPGLPKGMGATFMYLWEPG